MSQIGLIIQRTFNGLTIEHSSNPTYEGLSPTLFLTDERTMAMQLSPDTPVVSMAQDGNFKCYSFINATLDRERRSGFYAIRLFVPASKELHQAPQHLMNITREYLNTLSNNLPHNYEHLLQTAQGDIRECLYTLDVDHIQKGTYYLAGAANMDIVFQNEKAVFVEKLYGFQGAIAPDHIDAFQLQSLDSISIRKVFFQDPVGHVHNLYINGKKLTSNRFKEEKAKGFNLIIRTTDTLSYDDRYLGERKIKSEQFTTRKVTIKGPTDYIKAFYINQVAAAVKPELTMCATDQLNFRSIYDKEPRPLEGDSLSIKALRVDNREGQIEALWVDNTSIPLKAKETTVYALEGETFYYKLKTGQREALPPGQKLLTSPPKPAAKEQGTAIAPGVAPQQLPVNWLLLGLVALAGFLLGGLAGYLLASQGKGVAPKEQQVQSSGKQKEDKDSKIKQQQDAPKEIEEKAQPEAEKEQKEAENKAEKEQKEVDDKANKATPNKPKKPVATPPNKENKPQKEKKNK